MSASKHTQVPRQFRVLYCVGSCTVNTEYALNKSHALAEGFGRKTATTQRSGYPFHISDYPRHTSSIQRKSRLLHVARLTDSPVGPSHFSLLLLCYAVLLFLDLIEMMYFLLATHYDNLHQEEKCR